MINASKVITTIYLWAD